MVKPTFQPTQHPSARLALSICLVLGLGSTLAAQAQTALPNQALNMPPARITDARIAKDYQSYQTQQAAIRALNDTGSRSINSYSIAKAQCWLDVSFHEMTRNDRSRFTLDAINESYRITEFLRTGQTIAAPLYGDKAVVNGSLDAPSANPASQTLLINNGQRLRTDLWDKAASYKTMPGYGGPSACGERQVACAEVELAHAGNEINQQGWRHARPYIQLAEDYLTAAKGAMDQCAPAAPPPVVYMPAPAPAPVPVQVPREVVVERVVEKVVERFVDVPRPVAPAVVLPPVQLPPVQLPPIQLPPLPPLPVAVNLAAEVLFNYNKRSMNEVRDYTLPRLDSLITQIKSGQFALSNILITGHADRTNNTKQGNYNEKLSQDRASAVRDYMVSRGVPANLISIAAQSDGMPIEACSAKFKSPADLQECLLPNRRVVVNVKGVR